MSSSADQPRSRRRVAGLLLGLVVLVLVAVGAVVASLGGADGRTGGTDAPVAPTYRESRVIASDTFERQVAKGWGEADAGGPYQLSEAATFRVQGGAGSVTIPRSGSARLADLQSVRGADLTSSLDVIAPRTARQGSGVYVAVHHRSNGEQYYRTLLRFGSDQKAYLSVSRIDSPETTRDLVREHTVATRVRPGQRFVLTSTISGATPVELRASAQTGRAAPTEVQGTDATATRLVRGGPFALWTYVAASSDADKVIGFDNLNVRQLRLVTAEEAAAASEGTGAIARPPRRPAADRVGSGDAARGAGDAARGGEQETAAGGLPGAAPLGSTDYAVPDDAVFVAPTGTARGPGTRDAPYATVTRAVATAPDRATIVLREGSYPESVLLPEGKRLTLQAYPGEQVWLDGSSVLEDWQRSGGAWETDWDHAFDPSPTYTQGAADRPEPGWSFLSPAFPMAAHPEQVWVDGHRQSQVARRSQVAAGTFFVDRRRNRLVLGADPTSAEVRASTVAKGLTVLGAGDVVRGIGVRRYATSVWQMGAATVNTDRVRLENMVFADNATTGLSVFAADVTLTHLTAVGNGLMGFHANHADGLDVNAVLAEQNNLEHFNRAPAAGGMKVTSSRGVRIGGSTFADNDGHGLWIDASANDVDIVGSRAVRNSGSGAVVEISTRVRVVNNVFVDNGLHGLWVIDTDRVDVANNTMARNAARNLLLVTDGRSPARPGPGAVDSRRPNDPEMTWVTDHVSVYNNVFSEEDEECLVCSVDHTRAAGAPERQIVLDHNYYQVAALDGRTTFARWPTGSETQQSHADVDRYRSSTGQDGQSVVVVGGPWPVGDRGGLDPGVRAAAGGVAGPLTPSAAAALGDAAPPPSVGAWLE